MQGWQLRFATLTDVGLVRNFNEDTVHADPESGIALVADGMGGHRAGEVASRMARDHLLAALQGAAGSAQRISAALEEANRAIFQAACENPAWRGMGTTVALLQFQGEKVILAHVGDSRIYRLRDGRLSRLTRDDSLLNDQVEMGLVSAQQAVGSHNRHLVTQALGIGDRVTPRLRREDLREDDLFLICSDGLHDLVEESDIDLILTSLQANLPLAARHLVDLANDLGGFDNTSVVLAKAVRTRSQPRRRSWLARLRHWWRRRG